MKQQASVNLKSSNIIVVDFGLPQETITFHDFVVESLVPAVDYFYLLRFSGLYVSRARDLAKSGQKDLARDWLRFFNNSQIPEILTRVLNNKELKEFCSNLRYLESECHPLDVPNHLTDLQSIRAHLENIFLHVQERYQVAA